MRRLPIALIATAACFAAACGGEGGGASTLAPLFSSGDAGTDASLDAPAETSVADSAPESSVHKKRTVSQRDPFGNYGAFDNLMIDGDFEWTGGSFSSQTPWWKSPMVAVWAAPNMVVGARCRSGIKCIEVGENNSAAGAAVGTHSAGLSLSAWVHPSQPDCSMAEVSVGSCLVFSATVPVDLVSPTPDAEGWCHFNGVVPATDSRPCVYVSNEASDKGSIVVDDVVLLPTTDSGSGQRRLPSARHRAAVEQLRAGARELFQPHPPAWASPPPVEFRRKVR